MIVKVDNLFSYEFYNMPFLCVLHIFDISSSYNFQNIKMMLWFESLENYQSIDVHCPHYLGCCDMKILVQSKKLHKENMQS